MSYPVNTAISYALVVSAEAPYNGPFTCDWVFPDGTTASGLSTNKTFATLGQKIAKVTVTNQATGITTKAIKTVNIANPVGAMAGGGAALRVFQGSGRIVVAPASGTGRSVYSLPLDGSAFTSLGELTTPSVTVGQHDLGGCVTADGKYAAFVPFNASTVTQKVALIDLVTGGISYHDFSDINSGKAYSDAIGYIVQPTADNRIFVAMFNSAWGGTSFVLNPGTLVRSNLATGTNRIDYPCFQDTSGNVYALGYGVSAVHRKWTAPNYTYSEFTLTTPHNGYHQVATVRMANGKCLIVGGNTGSAASNKLTEFDPAGPTFTAKTNLSGPRTGALAVALADGKVLIAGGSATNGDAGALDTAEVYDPNTNTTTPTSAPMSIKRWKATATRLPSGNVMIVGGINSAGAILTSVEFYHPADNRFYSVD